MFVFSNAAQDRWHFLNVKYDEKSEKRRLFRRITVGPGERLRTASERVARGEVVAHVNTQVLSDLLHKLMLTEAYTKGLITRRQASALKERLQANRALAASLTDYQTQFENTLAIDLKVLRINRALLIGTKDERATYGLMTGDSLYLGNMNRRAIPLRDIVTYDSDFAHLPGLTVWEPMDVIP